MVNKSHHRKYWWIAVRQATRKETFYSTTNYAWILDWIFDIQQLQIPAA